MMGRELSRYAKVRVGELSRYAKVRVGEFAKEGNCPGMLKNGNGPERKLSGYASEGREIVHEMFAWRNFQPQ